MNDKVKSLTKPTIHLNGSSAERLAEGYKKAYDAIGEAVAAVRETAPNGRDYPEIGTLEKAQAEHPSRLTHLSNVLEELETLTIFCLDRGDT